LLGQNVICEVKIIFNNNNLNYINVITIIALRIALLKSIKMLSSQKLIKSVMFYIP